MRSIVFAVVLLVGCGDDSSRPVVDASADAARDSAAPDTGFDAAIDAFDGDPDADPVSDGGPDASSEDAEVDPDTSPDLDAATDAALDDAGTPIPVQCRSNDDCDGPAASCNREAPGGICLGCTTGTCPSGTSCGMFGACERDCDDETDCGPGWQCLGSGRCGLISCGACPDPYVCDEGRCKRPACPCPTGWSCESGLCMEP